MGTVTVNVDINTGLPLKQNYFWSFCSIRESSQTRLKRSLVSVYSLKRSWSRHHLVGSVLDVTKYKQIFLPRLSLNRFLENTLVLNKIYQENFLRHTVCKKNLCTLRKKQKKLHWISNKPTFLYFSNRTL